MGWIRFPHQLDPDPRLRADDLRTLLTSGLRRILHRLCDRNHLVNADLIRRVPAGPDIRTHAGKRHGIW